MTTPWRGIRIRSAIAGEAIVPVWKRKHVLILNTGDVESAEL